MTFLIRRFDDLEIRGEEMATRRRPLRTIKKSNGLSLVRKALSYKSPSKAKRVFKEEDIHLAIAWIDNKVTIRQIMYALDMKHSTPCINYLTQALKKAREDGVL